MPPAIQQRLLILQYAVISILMGLIPLGGIVIALVPPSPAGSDASALKPAALALAIAAVPVWILVRMLIRRQAAARARAESAAEAQWQFLIGRYGAICVLGAALLEGAAIFAIIVYALSREPEMLAAAVAPAVAILFMFPTAGNFRDFAEQARRPV